MENELTTVDLRDFPEHNLGNRVKLSYKWMNNNYNRILDGGCSYAYGSRFLARKSNETYGIDVNKTHIKVAAGRYKNIKFKVAPLEDTGFDNELFECIVLNDVLEHTTDKIATLEEMHRILSPRGILIISTPHKGLFAFLDPYNYGYYLKRYLPFIYKTLYKLIRLMKDGQIPESFNPEHQQKHYHYSLADFREMLNSTKFKDNYTIERVFRSGLFMEVLVMNLESILNIFMKQRYSKLLLKPLHWFAEIDYWIPYGILSYNIALKLKKLK